MQKRVLFFAIVIFFAAGPSWAQTCKTANIAATTGHLAGKTDGTVVDSKTKLMWKRCPEGFNYASNVCSKTGTIDYSWTNALARPATVNNTGFPDVPKYKNWRLPNIKELQSIVEEQCWNPSINSTAFPTAAGAEKIWSNSPSAAVAGSSWYLDFLDGAMTNGSRSTENLGVRLVRDCTGTECD